MQRHWLSEIKHNKSHNGTTDQHDNFRVCDIYLDERSEDDLIHMASDLTKCYENAIVSVSLHGVRNSVHGIIKYLSHCKHLISVCINRIVDAQDAELLATTLPHLAKLQHVAYCGSGIKADTAVVSALQCLLGLKRVELEDIELMDDTVALSNMTLLEAVRMHGVQPVNFLLPHLPQCINLTSLYVTGLDSLEDRRLLSRTLPGLVHLQYIWYEGGPYPNACYIEILHSLLRLKELKHIQIGYINLGDDDTLVFTPQMTQLEKVGLYEVYMSSERWGQFVKSLLGMQRSVEVTLGVTNIDENTLSGIRESSRFVVSDSDSAGTLFVTFSTLRK